MKTYKKLFNEVQPVRRMLYMTIGLRVFGGVLLVVQAYLLSLVIAGIFMDDLGLGDVQGWLLMLAGVALVRAWSIGWSEYTAQSVAGNIKFSLRERLFKHLHALGPAYIRQESSGELVNTATEGIEALDAYFRNYLPQIVLSAMIPLAILLLVFPVDILSALVFLLTAPFIPLMMMLIGRWSGERASKQFDTLSIMSAHFLDTLQGLTTLKILGRNRDQIQVVRRVSRKFRKTTMGVVGIAFLSALFLELLSTISIAIIAVEIGLRLLDGNMVFQEALFILIIAPEFYQPLRALGSSFHDGMNGVAAAARIYAILEIPLPESREPDNPVSVPEGALDIRFDNVSFRYRSDEKLALQNISFNLKAGQKLALVGPSGAGKSTLAYLLLKFIVPQEGQVHIGEVPLHEVSPRAWREKVGWIPQSPYLFNTTILENIRLARPQATLDEVIWAAQQASLHETIQQFADGYDTVIGERGTRLSGGQAQRLALARVFLKDAPMIILDEATANLDPDTEALITAALEKLLIGRTVVMIAHRLNTVHAADQILVLDKGQIIQSGNHAALVEQTGLYRQMVSAFGGTA